MALSSQFAYLKERIKRLRNLSVAITLMGKVSKYLNIMHANYFHKFIPPLENGCATVAGWGARYSYDDHKCSG